MNEIKLIIFDLSGVCFEVEEPPYLDRFIKNHLIDKDKFLTKYDNLLKKAERNEIEGVDMWNTLLSEFNIKGDPSKIIREMMDLKIPHSDILTLASKLKDKYTTVYLTNYNKDYWDEILRRFDFGKWFSWGVVSYQIGFRKPAKEGFEYILNKAKVQSNEAVFIDDSDQNLEEPRALGIKTLWFKDSKTLRADLENLGVKIS